MTFRESQKVSMMRLFLAKNPRVGVHFDKEERQAEDITTNLDKDEEMQKKKKKKI